MSAEEMEERIAEASPRLKARIAGLFYLLNILMGVVANFFVRGRLGSVVYLIGMLCNLAVTLLFYGIFKPVSRSLSLLAASFGLLVFILGTPQWHPHGVDIALIFYGSYCLLIGYLIFRSGFLPRILGALVAFAGLCWLTFLFPPLRHYLYPYNLASGVLGQGSLMLWLIVMGVNVQRWKEQASAAGRRE